MVMELTEKDIQALVLQAVKDASEAKAIAQEAIGRSEKAIQLQTENEARLKSIQHRVDTTEGKLDTMLDGVSQINLKLKENTAVTVGVKTTLKVFMAIISLSTFILGIIRAVPQIRGML